MTRPEPTFTDVLAAHFRQRRAEDEVHPTVAELLAYRSDELEPEDGDRMREHLARCRDCAEMVVELASPAHPEDSELDDLELERAWREQRERLRETLLAEGLPPRRSSTRALLAVAAIVVAALLFRLVMLERAVRELRGPQVNVAVFNLEPAGATRADPGTTLAAPAGASRWVLILHPAETAELAVYRAEIVAAGRTLRVLDGLRPGRSGSFTLELPADALAPGDYRIRLIGLDGEAESPIEEYFFRVEPPPGLPSR